MENLGGGAEEATGKPESLWGKIDPMDMGDRARRGKPPELVEKMQKSKKKKERDLADDNYMPKRDSKRRKLADESVSNLTQVYETLLSIIEQHLGGQPQDILCGAADEVLVVIKNDKLEDQDKRKEIEKLLNVIENHTFDTFVLIGRLFTDIGDANTAGESFNDDIGVAVEFEEVEESDYYDQVQEEEEDGIEAHRSGVMQESGWLKRKRQLLERPTGSYCLKLKGYEEFHVPDLQPKPLAPGEELIKIGGMPDWAQPAFSGMDQLNRVQSKVYETALFTTENLLLCAPTGAGKTNVAMLTILQQIALNRNPDGSFNNSDHKIVYVAPMKALVEEIVGNFSNRLQYYNVQVKELSGDQTLTHQQIVDTQIIVSTPEKWDIVTRKSGGRIYTQLVKLLIIDEIHLLHDNRGPVLESIVAKTVQQIETTKEHIWLVGLSATFSNSEDVALFLRVDREKGLFYFDNSYRHCPLAQQCIGISVEKPLQRFQLMNDLCYEKVLHAAGKHQVLIFVHSGKETYKTGCAIKDTALASDTLSRFLKEDSASREILQSHTDLVKSDDLKKLLPYGFAIHHDGMARADRQLVEDLFADGRANPGFNCYFCLGC